MDKVKSFVRRWKGKKRVYVILVIVAVVLFFSFKPTPDPNVAVGEIKRQDLESTVLASGEVTSKTNLALSFNSTGLVKTIRVEVGDKVSTGQILATLENGSVLGALKSAEGTLKAAQAKYQKLLEGSSNEEINLARVALVNAENDLVNVSREQNILVANTRKKLLNADLEAIPESANTSSTAPAISGTYTSDIEGVYTIKTYGTGAGAYFAVSGLGTSSGPITTGVKLPMGVDGLYVQFPSSLNTSTNETWRVEIPNKKSSEYVTNLNTYQAALETRNTKIASAEAIVDAKKAELDLKLAKARGFELDLALADIASAQGGVETARANYENTIVRAPASGTVTKIDIKLGELAVAQKEVFNLEDISNLYVEALINEANIIKIKPKQQVVFSIDSFGPEVSFLGEVTHIDPSATTDDGIVNYKIKVSIIDAKAEIKPGMNADIRVSIDKKENILVAPKLAIVERDGKNFIRVITDPNLKKYSEKEVEIGFEGDGNLIEIKGGAVEGEQIAIVTANN